MSTSYLKTTDAGMVYRSGKTYTHSLGLSCCFRQWRATSHCCFLHGYALQVELTFESSTLDDRNWVEDFGGLNHVKKWLCDHFDHKTLVAHDDPLVSTFREMHAAKMIDMVLVEGTGCEAFARWIFNRVGDLTVEPPDGGQGTKLVKVLVREHEANWASYGREDA